MAPWHRMRRACRRALVGLVALAGGAAAAEEPTPAPGFLSRFGEALVAPAAPADADAPAPLSRALASPLAAPPFPAGDYPGLFLAGPWSPTSGPLMQALAGTGLGRVLEESRISVYGWASGAMNVSTSSQNNLPLGYDRIPDRPELNQALLRIERLPDTAQTDHVDWGFRVDNLYGLDYRFTTAKGILSNQLLKYNNSYGYDPFVFYGEVYLPWVAQGMTVRFGRYTTLTDVESVTAPDNYLHTHSIANTYDAYTQMGVLTTTRLSQNWSLNLGVSGGNDIALWANGAKPTGTICLRYVTDSGSDGNQACVSSIGNPRYAYGNVQNFVANAWTHRFSERLHMATEVYYLWQTDVPGIGYAASKAFINFLAYSLSDVSRLVLRNEVFDDRQGGQRTGYKTIYSTTALGYAQYLTPNLILRPELRFDHAYDTAAYDNGRRRSQFVGVVNLITRF
jgi:Putative beta-barrel porin-2, OmpL-like. bbp2